MNLPLLSLIRAIQLLPSPAWMSLEVTMPQFKVLTLLLVNGSIPMTALAHRLQVSMPTASGIVDRLVRQGLALREEDPDDRRVVRVTLTGTGHSTLKQLFDANVTPVVAALESLAPDDRAALDRGVRAMIESIQHCTDLRQRGEPIIPSAEAD